MTIVHEGFSSNAPGGSATTIVINAPSGVQAGDVLVAAIIGGVASGTLSVTASGWSVQSEQFDNLAVLTILTRVAGGSEPSSYTFNYSVSASTRRGAIQRFSGVDNTNPTAGTPTKNNGSGTTVTGLSITTTEDDAWVGLYAGWSANSASFTPSGITSRFAINRCGGAGDIQASAGASGNKTATIANSNWRTIMVALAPQTEEPNVPPTVVLETPDQAVLDASGAVLEFTGTDPAPYTDDITYQVQISDSSDLVSGEHISDQLSTGGSLTIHPQPLASGDTWEANIQVDDRPGQSFTARGGILKKIGVRLVNDDQSPNGTARILVYEHQGTYGTSSAPLNAAAPANTPTPDWIAESDGIVLDSGMSTNELWYDFTFTGSNQVRLIGGRHYIFIVDWIPNNRNQNNTWGARGDALSSGSAHDGNLYVDGASVPNNGPQATWDLFFRVYEESILIDKVSDVDTGFQNLDTPADTDPFNSGDTIRYTSDALTPTVYYWRARGKDPAGSNSFGSWSETRSFSAEAGNLANLSVIFEDANLSADATALVSASLDAALADAILSAAGSAPMTGGLNVELEGSDLAADGDVLITASLDLTIADATLEASGTVGSTPITADLEAVLDDTALNADAAVLIGGSLDAGLGNASLSAAAVALVTGDLEAVLEACALSADGSLPVSGALEVILDDATLSAGGTLGDQPIVADLAIVFEDAIISTDGSVLVSAGLDAAFADATLSADAALPVTGTLDAALGDATLEASGTLGSAAVVADLDQALADTDLAASGTVSASAMLDALLDGTMLDASATVGYAANGVSLSAIFEDAMLSANASVLVSAGLAVTLADGGVSADGLVPADGSLDMLLADAALSSYGIVGDNLGRAVILFAPGRRMVLTPTRGSVFSARRRNFRLIMEENQNHDETH